MRRAELRGLAADLGVEPEEGVLQRGSSSSTIASSAAPRAPRARCVVLEPAGARARRAAARAAHCAVKEPPWPSKIAPADGPAGPRRSRRTDARPVRRPPTLHGGGRAPRAALGRLALHRLGQRVSHRARGTARTPNMVRPARGGALQGSLRAPGDAVRPSCAPRVGDVVVRFGTRTVGRPSTALRTRLFCVQPARVTVPGACDLGVACPNLRRRTPPPPSLFLLARQRRAVCCVAAADACSASGNCGRCVGALDCVCVGWTSRRRPSRPPRVAPRTTSSGARAAAEARAQAGAPQSAAVADSASRRFLGLAPGKDVGEAATACTRTSPSSPRVGEAAPCAGRGRRG